MMEECHKWRDAKWAQFTSWRKSEEMSSCSERAVRRAGRNESLGPLRGPRCSMLMLMNSGVRISAAERVSRRRVKRS